MAASAERRQRLTRDPSLVLGPADLVELDAKLDEGGGCREPAGAATLTL